MAAQPCEHIPIAPGGITVPVISPGDVSTPDNWFLPFLLLIYLYPTIPRMEIKGYLCQTLMGKFSPQKRRIFTIPCVLLPRCWWTLKVRPCVSSITIEGKETVGVLLEKRYVFVQMTSCKLCDLHSCTQEVFLSQRENVNFYLFVYLIKKKNSL